MITKESKQVILKTVLLAFLTFLAFLGVCVIGVNAWVIQGYDPGVNKTYEFEIGYGDGEGFINVSQNFTIGAEGVNQDYWITNISVYRTVHFGGITNVSFWEYQNGTKVYLGSSKIQQSGSSPAWIELNYSFLAQAGQSYQFIIENKTEHDLGLGCINVDYKGGSVGYYKWAAEFDEPTECNDLMFRIHTNLTIVGGNKNEVDPEFGSGGGGIGAALRKWNPSAYDLLDQKLRNLFSINSLEDFLNELFNIVVLFFKYLVQSPVGLITETPVS